MDTVVFGPFRLDLGQRLLLRPGATVPLRPKTLEVLLLLLRRADEVVSKEEILATVWNRAAVSEYVLTTCISELRAALDDRGRQPRYLRTVHRTGYRLTVAGPGASAPQSAPVAIPPTMVGRARELDRLRAAFARSEAGGRQIVFITGEMGIGKTTLATHFVASCLRPRTRDVMLARGQCVERFGAGEPYMPVLEAVGRLGRSLHGPSVVAAIRRHAPAWLAQIPGLLPPEERAELRHEMAMQTHDAMLRQIADAFEALSERRPLVLLLEDLHLVDHATIELIAALALRDGPAHLMVLGTLRSAETFPAVPAFQRLKEQLLLHQQCEEIALAPLDADAVDAYLAARFDGMTPQAGLAATIHGRTEGNPLFVARLIDDLLDNDVLTLDRTTRTLRLHDDVAHHVPSTLRSMIEQRADALPPDARELLDAASVAGVRFWSAAVAAAVGREREQVERLCSDLSRQHGFLVANRRTDDAPIALGAIGEFSHALYQQVLYERIEVTRRRRLHETIGTALRDAWGTRAGAVAPELALHFERGDDPTAAVAFLDTAAAMASRRGAAREAVDYLDRALAVLGRYDGDECERRLDLLMTRGPAVLAVFGYASTEVHDNYQRALALARRLGNPMREMSCLVALSTCEQTRGELCEGEALAIDLVRCGERIGLPPPLLAQLHNPLSQVRMYQGLVAESLALAEAAVAGLEVISLPPTPPDSRPALWADPRVMLHCQHGAVSFAAGRFARAAAAVDEALRIAGELQHPFNQASALTFAALYEDTTGRWDDAVERARQAIETAQHHGFPFWRGIAQIFCGHAMASRGDILEGLALLGDGIDVWRSTGAALAASNHLNLLADARLIAGDLAGARAALDTSEAHAERTGERIFVAETYRLQAECRWRDGDTAAATRLLQRAIETARGQGTRLWELRSTVALHRLGPSAESRQRLEEIRAAFDDEPETRDVAAARFALGN